MLVSLAFGYRGDGFHGSQVQPDVDTVQGCFAEALRRLDWKPELLRISSRTDAGVHARMNLARCWVPDGILASGNSRILRALNDLLPASICVWGVSEVDARVEVQHASSRTYRYRLEMLEGWDRAVERDAVERLLKLFEGEHDFTNFCRIEAGRETVRTIRSCVAWMAADDRVVGFEMTASGFLWHQVRRIAAALCAAASGQLDVADIESALDEPEVEVDLGMAPAEWLVLWSTDHPEASIVPDDASETPPPPGPAAADRSIRKVEAEADALRHRAWLSQELAALLKMNLDPRQSRRVSHPLR